MNKLWILTLTWNASDMLNALKESLMPSLNDLDYTWLIKDNASKDDTLIKTASWDNPHIKTIAYKNNNQNFSAGMNYLFNEASPSDNDLILLLNNDVIFNDSTSLSKMINIMEKDASVGVVGAKLLYTNSNLLQHAGVVFDPGPKTPTHFRLGEEVDKQSNKNRLFQVVTGAVLLTRAEYFRNTFTNTNSGNHGMDEKYHWAFDDVDLCLSIHYNMKKKIVYCGDTNIYHESSASLKKSPTNKLFLPHNINYLKTKWANRYVIDKDTYTKDPNYNLY